MIITHNITMAMDHRGPDPVVDAVQGDTNTREVLISLTCGGDPWTIPAGTTGIVRFRKPDGTGGIYDSLPDNTEAVTCEESAIRVKLAPQVLTVPEEVMAQVELNDGEGTIGTFMFIVLVEKDPSIGAIDSEDYINLSAYVAKEVAAKIDAKGRILLWGGTTYLNAGTCSAGEGVSIPADDYTGFEVIFASAKSPAVLCSTGFLPIGIATYFSAIGLHGGSNLVSRCFSYNPKNSEIVFQGGYILSTETANDSLMLPVRIYGYK